MPDWLQRTGDVHCLLCNGVLPDWFAEDSEDWDCDFEAEDITPTLQSRSWMLIK